MIAINLINQGYGVILVPVNEKYKKVFMTKSEVRLKIIKDLLNIASNQFKFDPERIAISSVEIVQDHPLTTGTTMNIIYHYMLEVGLRNHPYFLIGADNIPSLCTWDGLGQLSQFPLLVVKRPSEPGLDDGSIILDLYRKNENCNYLVNEHILNQIVGNLKFIDLKVINELDISDLSSTQVRKSIFSDNKEELNLLYYPLSKRYEYGSMSTKFINLLYLLYKNPASFIEH